GGSPFEALSEHIRLVDRSADLLVSFFQASTDGDWERAESLHQQIATLEHDADELKDHIRLNLPARLFMPVSRSDLLELAEAQDRIINKIKDIAGLMTGRRMQFPAALLGSVPNYIQVTIDAVHQARKVLEELDGLLESGFGRNISEVIEEMVVKVGKLEKRADREQVVIRQLLFQQEAELPPLEV